MFAAEWWIVVYKLVSCYSCRYSRAKNITEKSDVELVVKKVKCKVPCLRRYRFKISCNYFYFSVLY